MKRLLLAGFLVWLPIIVTVWVLHFIVVTMDSLIFMLPIEMQPKNLFGINIPGLGFIASILIFLSTGLLAANFLGQRLISIWDAIMKKIPIVNSIYASVKEVSNTLLSSNSEAFRKAVLVKFPSQHTYTMGFITGKMPPSLGGVLPENGQKYIPVFVPTTPNPTSGFYVIVHIDDILDSPCSVDEALKMIISLGAVAGKDVTE